MSQVGVRPKSDLLDALRGMPTGYGTDAFVRLGLTGWITGLRASVPLRTRRVVGPAITAWFAPIRGKRGSGPSMYAFLRESPPGSVVVISGGAADGVTVGSNMVTQAQVAGMEAIVTDGAVRDLAEIRELGCPVFFQANAIKHATWLELVSVNVAVTVGGARIHPGDIIFADEDGGLVIPPEHLEDVVLNAQEIAQLEAEQGRIIREGRSLDELNAVLKKKKQPRA